MAEGRRIYLEHCTACHGDFGEGGVGRPLFDVVEVFPSCDDHVVWITLGSQSWIEQVGPTYGAGGRVPEGVMPGFEATLSSDQIKVVAAYERSDFGGAAEASALASCGVPTAG